jgi:glutathione S-transferase
MAIKIYGMPQSTCTQRVVTTLLEKQVPYELILVNIMKGDNKSEDYLSKNPFGFIPCLDDDGFIVIESRAICRYIANKYKDQGTDLIPSESKRYGTFEQGAYFETNEFDPNASALVAELYFKSFRGAAPDEEKVKQCTDKLNKVLDIYDKYLAKQEYIGGNTFTLADIYHIPYGNLLSKVKLHHLITDRPHVKAWWEKITSRESWQKAFVSF